MHARCAVSNSTEEWDKRNFLNLCLYHFYSYSCFSRFPNSVFIVSGPLNLFFSWLKKRVETLRVFNTTNYWQEFEYKLNTGDFSVFGQSFITISRVRVGAERILLSLNKIKGGGRKNRSCCYRQRVSKLL